MNARMVNSVLKEGCNGLCFNRLAPDCMCGINKQAAGITDPALGKARFCNLLGDELLLGV